MQSRAATCLLSRVSQTNRVFVKPNIKILETPPEDAVAALPPTVDYTMTSYHRIPQDASNQYPKSPSFTAQAVQLTHIVAVHHILPTISSTAQQCKAGLHGRWNLRSFLTLGKILTVLWFLLLYWGERSIFRNSVDSCEWSNWENWVCYNILNLPVRVINYGPRLRMLRLTDSYSSRILN